MSAAVLPRLHLVDVALLPTAPLRPQLLTRPVLVLWDAEAWRHASPELAPHALDPLGLLKGGGEGDLASDLLGGAGGSATGGKGLLPVLCGGGRGEIQRRKGEGLLVKGL